MHNPSDPIAQMSELLAMLFAVTGDTIIENCGDVEGEKIIKKAVFRFGYERGRAIRETVLSEGQQITFENFERYHDIPENDGWICNSHHDENRLWEYTEYCPMAKKWQSMNLGHIGKYYCEVDYAIMAGYFGQVEFTRPKLFDSNDEGHCEMIVEII